MISERIADWKDFIQILAGKTNLCMKFMSKYLLLDIE